MGNSQLPSCFLPFLLLFAPPSRLRSVYPTTGSSNLSHTHILRTSSLLLATIPSYFRCTRHDAAGRKCIALHRIVHSDSTILSLFSTLPSLHLRPADAADLSPRPTTCHRDQGQEPPRPRKNPSNPSHLPTCSFAASPSCPGPVLIPRRAVTPPPAAATPHFCFPSFSLSLPSPCCSQFRIPVLPFSISVVHLEAFLHANTKELNGPFVLGPAFPNAILQSPPLPPQSVDEPKSWFLTDALPPRIRASQPAQRQTSEPHGEHSTNTKFWPDLLQRRHTGEAPE